MIYFVYILLSRKDNNKFYIGVTQNLEKRLNEHNSSVEEYSRKYVPWYIETYIAFQSKELAYQFEKYLKHGSGHAFLKKRFLPK